MIIYSGQYLNSHASTRAYTPVQSGFFFITANSGCIIVAWVCTFRSKGPFVFKLEDSSQGRIDVGFWFFSMLLPARHLTSSVVPFDDE